MEVHSLFLDTHKINSSQVSMNPESGLFCKTNKFFQFSY